MLTVALALRKAIYKPDTPVYITMDTSPIEIGWVVNQEDENETRFPSRFGALVSGCATPDLAMLRWIAYIKSLNPEIRHIFGKDNTMADMHSKARFENEDGMVSENQQVGANFFKSAQMKVKRRSTPPLNEFDKNGYDEEWLLIGRFLTTMTEDPSWTREECENLCYSHIARRVVDHL